ncbi:MAG TPA: Clp protease N-terminal domain-containing protein, partial [Actinomycetes bacterium]
MDKLTTKSQEALSSAVQRATTSGHPQVEPVHLLLALLSQADGTTAPLLDTVNADRTALREEAEQIAVRLPSASGTTVSSPQVARPLLAVLNAAGKLATDMDDEYVSTEHLLVALATNGGEVANLLRRHGATTEGLEAAFTTVRGTARVTSPDPEGTYQALEKYGRDLTAEARAGKVDPVIGRDSEIRRVVQ